MILVDDEVRAREGMRELLAKHDTIEVIGEASTSQQAVSLIQRLRPDVVFLDIEMHGSNGFDLLQQLSDPPAVVFVTAHSQFAVQGFQVAACDYLLKPVRPSRLAETIKRLHVQLRQPDPLTVTDPKSIALLRIKAGDKTVAINPMEIVALMANRDYTTVLCEGRSPLLAGQSLGQFGTLLPNPPFIKLDRSLIVNSARIRYVQKGTGSHSQLILNGHSSPLTLGRTAASRLANLRLQSSPVRT